MKNLTLKASLISFTLIFSFGCGKKINSKPAKPDFPERVGEASDATSGENFGTIAAERSGNISVDLSKLPEYGSPNLWSCFQIPADNVVLGQAVCATDTSRKADIAAKNVEFSCYQNPDFANRSAKEALAISECDALQIFFFRFSPELQVIIRQ